MNFENNTPQPNNTPQFTVRVLTPGDGYINLDNVDSAHKGYMAVQKYLKDFYGTDETKGAQGYDNHGMLHIRYDLYPHGKDIISDVAFVEQF